ncbi:MAG: tetratricopeptide repeat protein [Pseudomonadota bacterium]
MSLIIPFAIHAEEYGDIQKLIKNQDFVKALELTEAQLARSESDIKLHFLQGLILTRLGRMPEAEQVFIELTKKNPQLPEPYNNLAVVYAAQGKYSEAEQALKDAINTHPSYATAHENLGDIYAKMASRAYNQALELDTANQSARAKLSLVNELISEPTTTVNADKPPTEVVARQAPIEPPESKQKKPVVIEPEPAKVASNNTVPQQQQVTEKKESVKVMDDINEERINNRDSVELAVKAWAKAWSSQNVEAYLASYSDDFDPGDNKSLSRWQSDRKVRLRKPSYIKVSLNNIKVNMHGNSYAVVRFQQRYESNTYADSVGKELILRKYDSVWLITQEKTL